MTSDVLVEFCPDSGLEAAWLNQHHLDAVAGDLEAQGVGRDLTSVFARLVPPAER